MSNSLSARLADDAALPSRMRELSLLPPKEGESGGQTPLRVKSCDTRARDNALVHRTAVYELAASDLKKPVLRRGQPFLLALAFDRPFDAAKDVVELIFRFEESSGGSKGLNQRLTLSTRSKLDTAEMKWDAVVQKKGDPDANSILVQVQIPAVAQVGAWELAVQTKRTGYTGAAVLYQHPDIIYVLFNPWCPDDDVYMEDNDWKTEYVLNDQGKVYCGIEKFHWGKLWYFGQFDAVVLPCVVTLLQNSLIKPVHRGNPVHVTRALTRAMTSQMPVREGLLIGNWSDDFSGGTPPSDWTSSVDIMREYMQSGPVRYAQCWVFSAAIVTACRGLGIPCRSVSNFVSGHDVDKSLTMDMLITDSGIEAMGVYGPWGFDADFVWNFHVWNDAWMKRHDVPDEYSGWQAIDGTPQEMSQVGKEETEGFYQCGPAPVEAVRRGYVGIGYDTEFVYAEVNADTVYYREKDDPEWKRRPVFLETDSIGKLIVTKMVGKNDNVGDTDKEDITQEYKPREGSSAERAVMLRAVRTASNAATRDVYENLKKFPLDVSVELMAVDSVAIGQPFSASLLIRNTSSTTRTLNIKITANAVDQRGRIVNSLNQGTSKNTLEAGSKTSLSLQVRPEHYIGKVTDDGIISIYGLVTVEETEQTWFKDRRLILEKPRINVQFRGKAIVDKDLVTVLSFQNPLGVPLTGCKFNLTGRGLGLKTPMTSFRDVSPRELVELQATLVPLQGGPLSLIASFSSRELRGLQGSAVVDVQNQ